MASEQEYRWLRNDLHWYEWHLSQLESGKSVFHERLPSGELVDKTSTLIAEIEGRLVDLRRLLEAINNL